MCWVASQSTELSIMLNDFRAASVTQLVQDCDPNCFFCCQQQLNTCVIGLGGRDGLGWANMTLKRLCCLAACCRVAGVDLVSTCQWGRILMYMLTAGFCCDQVTWWHAVVCARPPMLKPVLCGAQPPLGGLLMYLDNSTPTS